MFVGKDYFVSLFLCCIDFLFCKYVKEMDIEYVFVELFYIYWEYDEIDIQVVLVFVFWGCVLDKGKLGFVDLIMYVVVLSWFRKFFIVLFLGCDNFISYSKVVFFCVMVNQYGSDEFVVYKLVCVVSMYF